MTDARREVIDIVSYRISDENIPQVREAIAPFIREDSDTATVRTFGALANEEFYIAPDFDSCFEDDPVAFGLEEYMTTL